MGFQMSGQKWLGCVTNARKQDERDSGGQAQLSW